MSDKSESANAPSKLKPLFGEIDGKPVEIPVIGFNGPLGSGKTLAGRLLCPEETIEIAVEDSGATYGSLPVKQTFSMYKEVMAATGKTEPTPYDCFVWLKGIFKKIQTGDLTCRVLLIDPITDIQQGLFDWVEKHSDQFGKTPAQYQKMSGVMIGDAKAHMKLMLGSISRKVECVIYTAHMGQLWSGSSPVAGKMKVKGVDTFKELASLVVHLTREVDKTTGKMAGPPVGSIAAPHGKSRLSRFTKDDDGNYIPVPILPPRIEPFTWQKVREYVNTPPDYKKLKKGELAEVEVLSEDDKLLLAAETTRLEYETALLRNESVEKAVAAAARNKTTLPASVAKAMNKPATTTEANEEPPSTETKKHEQKADAAPVVSGNATPDGFPQISPWTREVCEGAVRAQMDELKLTLQQKKDIVAKRGKTKLAELSDEDIEDIRRKLWTVLTKRAIEARGKK